MAASDFGEGPEWYPALRAMSAAERQRLRILLQNLDGPPPQPWMTTKEVATYFRMTTEALHIAYCRRKKWLPPRYPLGDRQYRYLRTDVESCLIAG